MSRRILITGANKGIGLATVTAILEQQPDTEVLMGTRDMDKGNTARLQLLAEHPDWETRLQVLQIDVSNDQSVADAANTVRKAYSTPALFAVVNNAGTGFGDFPMRQVLEVNTYGAKRICEQFIPLLEPNARIVNVSSGGAPNYLSNCSQQVRQLLSDSQVSWQQVESLIDKCLTIEAENKDYADYGLDGSAYRLSKACLNAYTMILARKNPTLMINACTPGFIETDMTRPYAESQGVSPDEMGMKPPSQGTRAILHLLFGKVEGSGWYFGSDGLRSPLDRYRAPGDPPYTGD